MLAEGSDSRLLTFAFLLGQTQSPFANKSLVACNVKPSVIRFCKVLILTLQRKPRSNARFVSIPPCPCEVPNVFANLDRWEMHIASFVCSFFMEFLKLFSFFPLLFFFLLLWQTDTVAFHESVAPPMGRRGNAFKILSSVGPLPCDSHLMSIRLFLFFGFFLWNGLLLLNSEGYYERTLWNIAISLEYLYRIGPEIMCANFREIWRKHVEKIAKSVFWRKFKMAENLSWRKWAWPIWGDAPQPKESREKIILIFRHTVQEL